MDTCISEPISAERLGRLRHLEGRRVCVALRNGSRLDDCQLVSIGRNRASSIWLVSAGVDTFVAVGDVVEVWEAEAGRVRAA